MKINKYIFWHILPTGWPKVLVITLSRDKVVICLAIIVCSFLCPIFISCFLYVSMICIKKRIFLNRINATTNPLDSNRANSQNVEISENENQEERDNSDVIQNQLRSVDAQEVRKYFQNCFSDGLRLCNY